MMKYILIILALVLCSFWTDAQIFFKNNQKEPVMVALAQYTKTCIVYSWATRGWYTVNSGSTLMAFPTIHDGDSIGYWAMTTLSETVYAGTRNLLVHNDKKFTIQNADKASVLKQNPQYEWRKFRMVILSPGTVKGTIQLDR